MKSLLVGIKNVLLWSYARGTWQYDVLCLLIIGAVFLVPSRYFGDRDRTPAVRANEMHRIASKAGTSEVVIGAGVLQDFLLGRNKAELNNSPDDAIVLYLRDQLKRDVTIIKRESFIDTQGHSGYRVWFK